MVNSLAVKLVGMKYHSPPFDIFTAIFNFPLSLKRESNNSYDKNAVAVMLKGYIVGYLDRVSASIVAPILDSGAEYIVTVKSKEPMPLWIKSISLKISLESDIPKIVPPKPVIGCIAGIYQIVSSRNDWEYIGQSININKRISVHWKELSRGKHANRELQDKWNTLGASLFRVSLLEATPNEMIGGISQQIWLEKREQHWINVSRKNNICINVLDGEYVSTKSSLDETNELHQKLVKRHNESVIEKKKAIKNLIDKVQLEYQAAYNIFGSDLVDAERVVKKLQEFVRENAGLLGFIFGGATGPTIKLKKIELENAERQLDRIKSKLNPFLTEMKDLRDEYKKLKTIKIKK